MCMSLVARGSSSDRDVHVERVDEAVRQWVLGGWVYWGGYYPPTHPRIGIARAQPLAPAGYTVSLQALRAP